LANLLSVVAELFANVSVALLVLRQKGTILTQSNSFINLWKISDVSEQALY